MSPPRPAAARPSAKPAADHSIAAIERPNAAGANAPGFGSDVVASTPRLEFSLHRGDAGDSDRGLHDSIVNYLGNSMPQMLLCVHEVFACRDCARLGQGHRQGDRRRRAFQCQGSTATMAMFNAWCDRMPVVVLGATGPVDAIKAAALDRLDPHRARSGCAYPRLHEVGRSTGLARRRARSDPARHLDRQHRPARPGLYQSRRRDGERGR